MSSLDEIDELLAHAEKQLDLMAEKARLEKALAHSMPRKFEENILAFEKYMPQIAAQFRHYRPKETQMVCSLSGAANLIDNLTGRPLYGDDPVEQSRQQVEEVIENPKYTRLAFSLDEEVENTFIHTKYMHKIHQVFLDAQEELKPLTTIPEHLGSMILFGVGLGYHLRHLVDEITIDHLYICEPNTDWFFTSLYTCDWKYVLETIDDRDGSMYLHLGVSYKQFTGDFINELKDKGSFNAVNSVIYQHYPSNELRLIIERFSQDFHMVTIGWGFFDDGIISIAHDFANAQKKTPLIKKDAKLPHKWQGVPVFIVANGPSFDLAVDAIKEHEGEVVIFSCGSVLPVLLKMGIIPDFHLEVERTKFTYDYFVEFVALEDTKKINFLTANIMHPGCSDLFKWTGMGFKPTEASTIIASDYMDRHVNFAQLKFCNPQVANTALSFACHMGFHEIYLFGTDCGYKDPKYHHAKSSLYYTDDGEEKERMGKLVRAGEIEVDGNFGGKVFSTAFMNTGRFYMEHLLKLYPKRNVFNCSDGVKIEHAAPLLVEDLLLMGNLPDKSEVVEYLKSVQFKEREFTEQDYIDWLAIDKFGEICDELIKFTDKDFKSRSEIAKALMHQVRYLFSYSHSKYRHLYFLLEGSITYIHSVFRMILWGFEDEEKTVETMMEAIKLFNVYMIKAKAKYQRVLDEVDVQECYLMGLLKEGMD
jgi:hypothetical protein